jgi:Fe-S oxidoreductase
MWLESEINAHQPVRRKRLDARARVVATACPYCLLMFDDAIRSKGLGEQIQVMDVAEILERQLSQ